MPTLLKLVREVGTSKEHRERVTKKVREDPGVERPRSQVKKVF